MKTKRFYITENGNILNTKLGCFQTAGGQFLRRVFNEEMKYLIGVLAPVNFPDGLSEPELPIWEFLWKYIDEDDSQYHNYLCFTRIINKKREYYLICTSEEELFNSNMEIADTDIDLYLEDPNLPDDIDFYISELANYTKNLSGFTSLKACWKLGNPDFEERVRRYKILKEKGIQPPFSNKKRQRKPRKQTI
jgi:hypothetical protein